HMYVYTASLPTRRSSDLLYRRILLRQLGLMVSTYPRILDVRTFFVLALVPYRALAVTVSPTLTARLFVVAFEPTPARRLISACRSEEPTSELQSRFDLVS